jgi:hypothetical protein
MSDLNSSSGASTSSPASRDGVNYVDVGQGTDALNIL